MGRKKGIRQVWRLLGVNCEPDLYEALERFAVEQKVSPSKLGRLLLRKALEGEGKWAELVAKDLRDEGYRDGFRRGLADVHEHMQKLKVEE